MSNIMQTTLRQIIKDIDTVANTIRAGREGPELADDANYVRTVNARNHLADLHNSLPHDLQDGSPRTMP